MNRNNLYGRVLLVTLTLLVAGGPPASAEEPLTNEAVIALTQAGLGDAIVIQKVQQAPREALDVSTDALIHLKKEGVNQAVIEAIMTRVSARPEDDTATSEPAPAPASPTAEPTGERPAPTDDDTGQGGGTGQGDDAQPAGAKQPKWKFWKGGSKAGTGDSAGSARSASGDSYLRSDEYQEGEEITNVYFKEPEYALIREEFEYRGMEFDWAWFKGSYGGRRGKQFLGPSFNISDYSTARVVIAGNFSPSLEDGLEEGVKGYFVKAFERLGLTVTEAGTADLELGIAIVDYKSDQTYAFVAMIDPFIELEVRLRDMRAGEDLVLIRNQDHNSTPLEGAGDTAAYLMAMLK